MEWAKDGIHDGYLPKGGQGGKERWRNSVHSCEWGKYTGAGVFTIVEEADGSGASKWGLLKSYADKRNGWISLDYANRL